MEPQVVMTPEQYREYALPFNRVYRTAAELRSEGRSLDGIASWMSEEFTDIIDGIVEDVEGVK